MATLPIVPYFAFEEAPSIAKLNQLAAAVSFVTVLPAYASFTGNASQSLTTGVETPLQWPTKITDRDSGWNSGANTKYTAQTPGYYDCAAQVDYASNATGLRHAYFQVTTGSSNPGGAGVTTQFGAVSTAADPSTDTILELAQQSPYLYIGDFVQVIGFQNSGGGLTLGTAANIQWQITLGSLGP